MNPGIFVGYAGASIAFLLSVLGALENAGKTMYEVEDALDDWLKGYGKGKYEEILKDIETSGSMQNFLNAFTLDMVFYSVASMAHSFFLIGIGFFSAYTIYNKVNNFPNVQSPVPFTWSFEALLFGVVVGSTNYFAGNVSKNLVKYIFYSIGFNDHSYTNLENETIETTVVSDDGISMTTESVVKPASKVAYDYKKLLKMQDKWYNFFAIQRGMQMLAPYLFLACVEIGVISAEAFLLMYL